MSYWRFLGGGDPSASSPAFLLAPNPNVTFDRSLGTGVLPCEGESIAEILENLDLLAVGAGEPVSGVGAIDEKPEGPGLVLLLACDCGAGRVMKPVESRFCAFAFAASFFFDFFSVLLFDRG